MKAKFPLYYRPTSDEKIALFNNDNCYFVFDTNALLDMYRLGKDKSAKVLDLIDNYIDRIIVPFHVAEEYHSEMLNVITNQISSCSNVLRDRKDDDIISALCEQLGLKNYPTIKDKFVGIQRSALNKFYDEIKREHVFLTEQFNGWSLQERISDSLGAKVLEPLDDDTLKNIMDDGEHRYEACIPPGYKDKEKSDNKYGDLIIWNEILTFAGQKHCSIIFVSRDLKEDWILEKNGMKCGPRHELLEEFRKVSDGTFITCTLDKFIEYANEQQKVLKKDDLNEVSKILSSLSFYSLGSSGQFKNSFVDTAKGESPFNLNSPNCGYSFLAGDVFAQKESEPKKSD